VPAPASLAPHKRLKSGYLWS